MDQQIVAQIAGYTVTMGMVVAVLVEIAKRVPQIPLWRGQVWRIRLVVAGLCLGLNVLGMWLLGQPIDLMVLLPTFLSYASAAATYDHVFSAESHTAPLG